MRLFDLHCDTATRLLSEKQGLYDNTLHVSLKNAAYLENYAQVMAVWTHHKLNDSEGYLKFHEVVDNLEKEIHINRELVGLAENATDIHKLTTLGKYPLILSVEDIRILENDISRLDALYARGVRLVTLNWYGDTCIGGAHDTHNGLTPFGVNVVKRCFELGIIPDVSHSSFEGTSQTIELAKQHNKPIIASHSDSYSVNPHTRNLRDEDFIAISRLGGLAGINLCPEHLSSSDAADIASVVKHIEYYLSIGGENSLAMGCDLDGTNLPQGFSGVSDIYKIADELQKINYSTELTNKILYKNAFDFFTKNL